MAISTIKAFSEQAQSDPDLKAKLQACAKVRALIASAKDCGFDSEEVELYPPNEPQFDAVQLSEKLGKAPSGV
jgi:predicted ribosomally synthesized peptide with nif11-like leader